MLLRITVSCSALKRKCRIYYSFFQQGHLKMVLNYGLCGLKSFAVYFNFVTLFQAHLNSYALLKSHTKYYLHIIMCIAFTFGRLHTEATQAKCYACLD